jgi:pimeloyl-ACP methyl ester carboxylesterase
MNLREFRSQQRVAEFGDGFVSYFDGGAGDPVVLLHGFPTWGFLWHRTIGALAREQRVIVPDLIGYGFSDRSDRFDRSMARQAHVVVELMDRLGLHRAALVGHDIGGGIALRLAALFRGRVERLCLIDTAAYDCWPSEAMLQLGHPRMYTKLSTPSLLFALKVVLRRRFAAAPADEVLEELLAPYTTDVGKLAIVRAASSLDTNHTTELVPLLGGITTPALVLSGGADRSAGPRAAERLVWDLPNARHATIPSSRRFAPVEQPLTVLHYLAPFLEEARRLAAAA